MQAIRTTQLSCDLCVLNFTSQSQMDQHMDGKNHLKKLANESGNSNNFNSQKQESNWDSHPVMTKYVPVRFAPHICTLVQSVK